MNDLVKSTLIHTVAFLILLLIPFGPLFIAMYLGYRISRCIYWRLIEMVKNDINNS